MKTQIWTKEELIEQIETWKHALLKCAAGQSYKIGTRELTRYDLDDIKKMLDYLKGELEALENGRGPRLVKCRIRR